MSEMAEEYSRALGCKITYVDEPFEKWQRERLQTNGLPEHVIAHICTMAKMHAEDEYDRLLDTVQTFTGRSPTTVEQFIVNRPEIFKSVPAGQK